MWQVSGYSVVYEPKAQRLSLLRGSRSLAAVSISLTPDGWYGLRVVRDGVAGVIRVYLDQGAGYGAQPILEVSDATYPALGQVGWRARSSGYDFYVDQTQVLPLGEAGP